MIINLHLRNYFYFLIVFFINLQSNFGQVDSIQFFQEKISKLSQTSGFLDNSITYIDLVNNLTYQLRYTAKDSMLLYANEALELSKNINYRKGEFEALSNFQAYHLYKGEVDKAIQYGLKVIDEGDANKYPNQEMKVYNQLGQAYFIKQDYPQSYSYFLTALKLSEKNNNEFYKFKMNMNLGTLFNLLDDYDEAIKFYSAAKESTEKLDDSNSDAMLSSNLGYLYTQKGEYEKVQALLDKSISYFKKQNIKEWLAFSYATLGKFNSKLKKSEKALFNYKKALNIHNLLNDVKGRADIYFGLAKANYDLKNYAKAEEYVDESLSLYKSFKLNTGLEKSYRLLYLINKEQNQILKSLEYLELTEKLANDISIEKNKRNLNMLNAKLSFEKEKEDLKAENEQAINQHRKYIQWALVALTILFAIVLFILNANQKEKVLNKKLENQAVILNKNQKELSEINNNQDKLFSIVGHDLRGPIISLQELLRFYIEDSEGKVYFEKFAPQLKNDLDQVQFTMDNLLHWGKNQMTGNVLKSEKINVKNEIKIILQLFRNEIEKKSIDLESHISENHYVHADLDQFNVIFRNLISNAIKFTPDHGRITIVTEQKEDKISINISDSGVGMTETAIENLFGNSKHFTTYGTNNEKGTGLGLRLTKEMVIKNKGTISVKSQPKLGSQFIVQLPLKNID